MSQLHPSRRLYLLLYGLLIFSAPLPGYAEVEVAVSQKTLDNTGEMKVILRSELPQEVHISLIGPGFLQAVNLPAQGTTSRNLKKPGIYQYRLQLGEYRDQGLLPIEAGTETILRVTGSGVPQPVTPAASIPEASDEIDEAPSKPPAGEEIIEFRNPFGPAFDKLTVDEKIRMVQQDQRASLLSTLERQRLLGMLYNEAGVEQANRQEFGTAEKTLRQARSYLPGTKVVDMNLAFALAGQANIQRKAGQLVDAEKKMSEALQIASVYSDSDLVGEIKRGLAGIKIERGMALPKNATNHRQEFFLEALELDPSQPVALYELGNIAYADYQLKDALQYFQDAYALDTNPDLAALITKVQVELQTAGDFVTQERGVFKISFEGREVSSIASEVRKLLAEAQRDVGRMTGLRPSGSIPVVIYSGGQFTQILGLHSWAGGAYDGKIRLPVADLTAEDFLNGHTPLKQIVFHEYVHAVIHNRIDGNSLPLWFHEGLAQLCAGENPDAPAIRQQLNQAYASGTIGMPSQLGENFVKVQDPNTAGALYLSSYLFVKYLIDREGGWPRMRSLMKKLVTGESLELSFRTVYRKTISETEQQWAATR